jgi:hypothetical protein
MPLHRAFLCFLLLAVSPLVRGAAQVLPPDVVEQINAATRARVRLVEGARVTLYAPRADSTSLTYDPNKVVDRGGGTAALPAPLSIGQLAEIEVPSGSRAGRGAVIGGAVGAGIGAGLALLLIAVCSGNNSYCQPSSGQAVGGFVGLTLIGAGAGAGVGVLIGSLSPRWKTVYTR